MTGDSTPLIPGSLSARFVEIQELIRPVQVFRDQWDRIRIGPVEPVREGDPDPLVWIGHNQ